MLGCLSAERGHGQVTSGVGQVLDLILLLVTVDQANTKAGERVEATTVVLGVALPAHDSTTCNKTKLFNWDLNWIMIVVPLITIRLELEARREKAICGEGVGTDPIQMIF